MRISRIAKQKKKAKSICVLRFGIYVWFRCGNRTNIVKREAKGIGKVRATDKAAFGLQRCRARSHKRSACRAACTSAFDAVHLQHTRRPGPSILRPGGPPASTAAAPSPHPRPMGHQKWTWHTCVVRITENRHQCSTIRKHNATSVHRLLPAKTKPSIVEH
jgi:hypothetical protein